MDLGDGPPRRRIRLGMAMAISHNMDGVGAGTIVIGEHMKVGGSGVPLIGKRMQSTAISHNIRRVLPVGFEPERGIVCNNSCPQVSM